MDTNLVETAELGKLLDEELAFLVVKAHRAGLCYWDIFKCLRAREDVVIRQSEAEYWLNQEKEVVDA